MTAYLGQKGALLAFKGPSVSSSEQSRPASYRTTLGGKVKAQRGAASRRQWSVDIATATPGEVGALLALIEGGVPPWVWVEPYAQVTNLLTPEQSSLAPGTWSGPGAVEGGTAASPDGVTAVRTLIHPSGGAMGFALRDGAVDGPPILPGVPIAYSVYVRGSGALTISYRDWSGATLTDRAQTYSNPTFSRASFLSTPPEGAASVHLRISGALQAGNPAVSWTPDLAEWSPGRGCNRAVVDGVSEAAQLAVRTEPAMRRSQISFTVREVG